MASVGTRAERESADIEWLSGPDALEALAVALEPDGVELVAAQVHEVHHRPGAGVTVGYDVRIAVPGEATRAEYLLATTADLGERGDPTDPGNGPIVELATSGRTLHVWRHPMDPLLPGLAIASDIEEARRRVEAEAGGPHEVGDAALPGANAAADADADADSGTDIDRPDDAHDGSTFLELIGYRPLRRAVLSLSYPTRRVYLKVVRPDQLDGMLARNRFAEAAGAPRVVSVWPEAVLVFAEAKGEPLPESLARDGAEQVDPQEFLRCLDALDPAGTELDLRVPWARRASQYADAARNVLPEASEHIDALADGVGQLLRQLPDGPTVTTHGDFHAANILMTDNRVSALLDVDTLGPGQRVEDLACLIGHLSVLPSLAPGTYPHVPRTLERWLTAFDEVVDPVALRAHASGVVLSLLASMPTSASQESLADARSRLAMAQWFLSEALMREDARQGTAS